MVYGIARDDTFLRWHPIRAQACSGMSLDRVIWTVDPPEWLRAAVLPSLCPVAGEERRISEDGLALVFAFGPDAGRAPGVACSIPPSSPPLHDAPEGTPS